LFPLAVLGVDISRLVDGAHSMLRSCLRIDIASNPALMLASIAYLQLKKEKRVHDTFVFSSQLKSAAEWYRQLLAESIGKSPASGILPTVSVGSTDLHSVGQLDIAGPNSTYYRFISVKKQPDFRIPQWAASLVPGIGGKTFRQVLNAIMKGTQAAFSARKRPFIEIELPDLSAETIGGYLQTEMVSIMLLGKLLKVNPFDQPAVEEYKKATRALLR
jgi:glucose-6-phosphate isomerase